MTKKSTKLTKTEQTATTEIKNNIDTNKSIKTVCYLASKANYIVAVQMNGQSIFIQPFGKVKVIKEQVTINPKDAKHLTFIK